MTRLTSRVGDIGIALAFALLALLWSPSSVDVATANLRDYDALGYAFMVAQALPLIWRSRLPRTVLWVSFVLWAVSAGLGYPSESSYFPLLVSLYTVGVYLSRRQAMVHGLAVTTLAVTWTVAGALATNYVPWSAPVSMVLIGMLPIALGLADRTRRDKITELENATRRREETTRLAEGDAVRRERARIARELHDVVAHEMTVMTLQAEGAKRRAANTDPALAEVLATISESGRKGLVEMQRMIGVLRTSEAEAAKGAARAEAAAAKGADARGLGVSAFEDLAPMPALATIPALARQVEEAGLPVLLSITGSTHVPAGVELSAYRIVQESLTNALKYAGPGATATVSVRRKREAVTVTVEDDGRGAISDVAFAHGGHGLVGMRERVQALGGTLEIGPRKGGGFKVHATLPVSDDQIAVAVGRGGDSHAQDSAEDEE